MNVWLLAALLTVADLHPVATIATGGTPDWMAISPDSVWIANDAIKSVQRVDARTNAVTNVFPIRPQNSEGGVTAGTDSVWLATSDGALSRIDPATGRVRQRVPIPGGSFNPLYSDGIVWLTAGKRDELLAIDAENGRIVARARVGSKPRFLTASGGFVWTLNQGDGTISKVDIATKRLVARIDAHVPGRGGEISQGGGSVWATLIETPLTRVDVRTNAILGQWYGVGGDAVRYGHGSVWLTDYDHGRVWRIAPPVTRTAQGALPSP